VNELNQLPELVARGDDRALARAITWVENELPGYESLLKALRHRPVPVVGFTGPPGAGKSSLINGLAGLLSAEGKKTAIVAVDPTSPFNFGSLLADRVRMPDRFTDPSVFIRSVATRGSLGGLSEKIIEITDVLRSAPFDLVLVETVGVGQSEVEIAGLADVTVVVLVPESGDDLQALKSGIMEIADLFVINKADREGAGRLAAALQQLAAFHGGEKREIPVVSTAATRQEGLEELLAAIRRQMERPVQQERKLFLLAEKLYRMIQKQRMQDVDMPALIGQIKSAAAAGPPNIYALAERY
jgi:LAO/AO transport system kinase